MSPARQRLARAAALAAVPLLATSIACADGSSAQSQDVATPSTMEERASYAIGFNLGRTLRNDQIPAAIEQIAQGIRDGFAEAEPKITEEDMSTAMQELQQQGLQPV